MNEGLNKPYKEQVKKDASDFVLNNLNMIRESILSDHKSIDFATDFNKLLYEQIIDRSYSVKDAARILFECEAIETDENIIEYNSIWADRHETGLTLDDAIVFKAAHSYGNDVCAEIHVLYDVLKSNYVAKLTDLRIETSKGFHINDLNQSAFDGAWEKIENLFSAPTYDLKYEPLYEILLAHNKANIEGTDTLQPYWETVVIKFNNHGHEISGPEITNPHAVRVSSVSMNNNEVSVQPFVNYQLSAKTVVESTYAEYGLAAYDKLHEYELTDSQYQYIMGSFDKTAPTSDNGTDLEKILRRQDKEQNNSEIGIRLEHLAPFSKLMSPASLATNEIDLERD